MEGRNDVISGDAGGCGCEGGNGILSGRELQGCGIRAFVMFC